MAKRQKDVTIKDRFLSFFGIGNMTDLERAIGIITGFFFFTTIIGIGAFCLYVVPYKNGLRVLGFAFLTAGATTVAAFLVGYLFGMPRESGTVNADAGRGRIVASTSLEQIADWLTKIIVGLGIAEFRKVIAYVGAFTDYLDRLCLLPAGIRSLPIVLYFSPLGFLVGYFYARTFFFSLFCEIAECSGRPNAPAPDESNQTTGTGSSSDNGETRETAKESK